MRLTGSTGVSPCLNAKVCALFALVSSSLALGGCVEKQAADPAEIMREEGMLPPSSISFDDPIHTVRVAEDERGGLIVQAPPGARVIRPEGSPYPAEVEILMPPPNEGRPLRVTKSLGYIGDGKLGENHSRYGGSYNVPDNLLPPHQHGGWQYSGRFRSWR
jgi:hypothetical protein